MKNRRRQEEENAKAKRRMSDPPMPNTSRSSSLRNELLHGLRNNAKLQKLQQQQQQQQQKSVESAPASPLYHASTSSEDVAPLQQSQEIQPNNTPILYPPPSGPPSPTHYPVNNTQLRHSISNESTRSSTNQYQSQTSSRQVFSLSKLPTPRLALLTGSRKLISRLGQMPIPEQHNDSGMEVSPVCYLLETPATLRELTLDSSEHLNGHILVCMHHKVSNIFKFIYNLRYVYKIRKSFPE